jgi:hypothetical protein
MSTIKKFKGLGLRSFRNSFLFQRAPAVKAAHTYIVHLIVNT